MNKLDKIKSIIKECLEDGIEVETLEQKMSRAEWKRREKLREKAVKKERKEREIIMRHSNTPNGQMNIAAEDGKIDGRAIAFCIMSDILFDVFGWKKIKIKNFLKKCNMEAPRAEDKGVMFVLEFYANKLSKKMNEYDYRYIGKTRIDHVYYAQLEQFFMSAMAVMLSVLASDYHFGYNNKGTGKIDKIIDLVVIEYMKNQRDVSRNAEWFIGKMEDKIGIVISSDI